MRRLTRAFTVLCGAVTIGAALFSLERSLRADNTAQTLPHSQTWSNTTQITTDDNWTGVPGIVGYRGDDLTTAIGADPQTILADGTNTPVDVIANAFATNATGGVLEVEQIPDPTIAIQGSGTADAPFVLFHLNTSGFTAIKIQYDLRDLDASPDNAAQQVALHYRVGSSGNFTNLPAGYVADATDPGAAVKVTTLAVTLPSDADNQPLVQFRVMTTNAAGSDELVGIDDIEITGTPIGPPPPTNPTAIGAASPASVVPGGSTLLTVAVTPGSNPPSSGISVTADLSSISGAANQTLYDDGVAPDLIAGDNIFSFEAIVPAAASAGLKSIPVSVLDAEARTASANIGLTVLSSQPPVAIVSLPYSQNWSDLSQITADDEWSGALGWIGYRGDGLTAVDGVDPQTVLADGSSTPIDVNANETSPAGLGTGGIAEFHIFDPTIALQGSGTADAPHVVLQVSTMGHSGVRVRYNVRDIDASADNAIQPVALQYRVGSLGTFTNIAAAFVADATDGPLLAIRSSFVDVVLPPDADGQPLVQLRFITTNAFGTDEWVGIDDLQITDLPTGVGAATPSSVGAGDSTLLTVRVTPAAAPQSTGITVNANLSLIGGLPSQPLFDDGTNGDDVAGDNTFSYLATVAIGTGDGLKALQATIRDNELRSSFLEILLTVLPSTNLTAVGTATPSVVARGANLLLEVTVTPGTGPRSTGIAVAADLSSIGGPANEPLLDNGLGGDAAANDLVFSVQTFVASLTSTGQKLPPVLVADAEGRTANATIALTVVDPPPQGKALPFFQDWSNVNLIMGDDTWSGVPGIVGRRGDDLTTSTGTDPRLITADGSSTPFDVNANRSDPSAFITGGITEFDGIPNPTVALQGSGTADAPHLVIGVSTLGVSAVLVSYNLRDIDGSTDNATQPVALQYRVGNTGSFTNVPGGYVADASSGPSLATLVTAVSVLLPPIIGNQPLVEIRIITTNAVGNDEWIGVDDISIVDANAPTPPTGVGSASPNTVEAGNTTLLAAAVTPGANPTSTGIVVTGNLLAIGGSAKQAFFDDGTNGDEVAGDLTFSYLATVPTGTAPGTKVISGAIEDAELRAGAFNITLTVSPPPPLPVAIYQIQGSGSESPYKGLPVTTTGIVTGLKNNGFFIQAPEPGDADSSTSDGVFVFTLSAPPASAVVGSFVQATGTVQEFVPNADPFQRPVTEIGFVQSVQVLQTGLPLPAPILLTAADTMPGGGLEQLERFEGMRVAVDSMTVTGGTLGSVNETNATGSSNGIFYGVITGVARPFREPGIELPDPLPAGAPPNVPRFDGNPERLQVDTDGQPGATRFDVAAGDVVTGIVGPLDYSFRTYLIHPDPASPPQVVHLVAPTPVPVATADQLTVASANLERFFDNVDDPGIGEPVLTQTAFNNRLNKVSLFIRNILRSPDIIGVEEVENLSTLQAIATKVNNDTTANGLPNPSYQAYLVEGNDIGGIDSGFLVKASRVSVIDVTQVGKDSTYTNPISNQQELLNDRPSLVLRSSLSTLSGEEFPFTVIVNHLRSLSGVDDPADGPRVRAKRRAQAEELANLVQSRQLANPAERILLVGDFNAFQFNDGFVDSIGTIKGTPTPADQVTLSSPDLVEPNLLALMDAPLADLVDPLPLDERYSFVFDGNAQVLDHHIITQNLQALFDKLAISRSNADFPESARTDPNVPTRISDHDALVTYINLPATTQTSLISTPNPSAFGEPVTFTATVSAGGSPVAVGTVAFLDDGTPLATVALDANGRAVLTTGSLAPGTHVVTAVYGGAANFTASAVSVTQNVEPALSINDVTVNEGNTGTTAAIFVVTLTPASQQTVTVNVETADGTATAGSDYVPRPPSTLTFAAGITTQTIAVGILSDVRDEDAETFFVRLSNPSNAKFAGGVDSVQATGTITDNDAQPSLTISDDTVVESDAGTKNAAFIVRLSAPSGQVVTVDYSTADDTARAGTDYIAQAGTLEFPVGTVVRRIRIVVNGDIFNEANEVFFVNLSNPLNVLVPDPQARGTIVNDDRVRISIDNVEGDEPAGGAADFLIPVRLSNPSQQTVTVDYQTLASTALAGDDFVAIPATPPSTLVFAPGETEKSIAVSVLADNVPERPERFFVFLSRPVNGHLGDPIGVVRIIDGNAPRVTGIAPEAAAVGDTVTITGENFLSITSVKFDGKAASFTVASAVKITAIVPANATDGPITVRNILDTAVSPVEFKLKPKIDSFVPASGPVGTTITITGSGFLGVTEVRFGNGPSAAPPPVASPIAVITANSIRVAVPAGATTGKINITNAAGTTTSAGTFTVLP